MPEKTYVYSTGTQNALAFRLNISIACLIRYKDIILKRPIICIISGIFILNILFATFCCGQNIHKINRFQKHELENRPGSTRAARWAQAASTSAARSAAMASAAKFTGSGGLEAILCHFRRVGKLEKHAPSLYNNTDCLLQGC